MTMRILPLALLAFSSSCSTNEPPKGQLDVAALAGIAAATASPAAATTAGNVTAPSPTAKVAGPVPVGTHMKCPVSGEQFTVKATTPQIAYNGKSYAFCCADCLPDFNKNPAKYSAR